MLHGGGYPEEIVFGERECLCCIQHRHKKFLARGYPKGDYRGREAAEIVVCGPLYANKKSLA